MSSTAAVPTRRRIAWGLLAALAVYVGLRALVLHTAFDEVALWMYELYPMGTMAEFLHRGIDFPLRFYYDNAAGQILSGCLTWPCFALAGPCYLALKISPALMGIGVLVLCWRWLDRGYGRLTANLAAWALALAPTTFLKYSVTNSGNHFENIFFSVLALATFARLQRLGASRARLFLFGLSAGFALFVFLGALLPLAMLCVLHLGIRGLRRTLGDSPWIALGFVVGELPLLVLNLLTSGRGLDFLGAKFAGENSGPSGGALLARLSEYLWTAPREAATAPAALGLPGSFWDACIYAALVLGWIWALPSALRCLWGLARGLGAPRADHAAELRLGRDWPLVVFVGYVPLSALAFGLSNLRLGGYGGTLLYGGYRYYLPWFLYGMLTAAVLAARAWQSRGRLRAAAALLPLGLLLPGLANFALVDWSFAQTGMGLRYSGYDASKAARGLLSVRNALSHAEQVRRLDAFPPLLRAGIARALGFNLALIQVAQARKGAPGEAWGIEVCAIAADWPESLRHEIARGTGIGLRFSCGANESAALLPHLRRTLEVSAGCPEHVALFLEGLAASNPNLPLAGQTDLQSSATQALLELARATALPEEVQRGIVRGQGFLFGQLARRGIESDLQALEARRAELPPQFLPDFYTGLGAGCALQGEKPAGPDPRFALPPEHARDFWAGYVRELRRCWAYDRPALDALFLELGAALPAEQALDLRAALAGH